MHHHALAGRRGSITVLALVTALLALAAASPAAKAADQTPSGRPSVFGFQINTLTTDDQLRNLILDRARDSGASWARRGDFDWAALEPTQGTIDLSSLGPLDATLTGLADRGLQAQGILLGTPAWAQAVPGSRCGPIRRDKLPAFAHFVDTIVRRYAAAPFNVHRWEVWNEPDAPVVVDNPATAVNESQTFGCWGRPGDGRGHDGGEDFGAMLKAVYPVIKAADPGATVVFGGLLMGCGVDGRVCAGADLPGTRFLRGALDAGAAFDELAFHAYSYWDGQDADWDRFAQRYEAAGGIVIGKLHMLRAVLGGLAKPIVMDEGGLLWCNDEDPNSWCRQQGIAEPGDTYQQDQANYVVRLYTRAWANGIDRVGWYHLENGGWYGSGLLGKRADQPPRLGYQAMQALSGKLTGTSYASGTVSATGSYGGRLEDYRFCTRTTEQRVLWTNRAADQVSLELPSGTTAIVDKLGQPVPAANPLTIGFEPVVVQRELGHPCAAAGPGALRELTFRQLPGGWRQVALADAGPDRPARLWTRDSTNADGTAWGPWSSRTYAQAWGGEPGSPRPPADGVDAFTVWRPPGAAGLHQQVYAGASSWGRDADATGTRWSAWSATTLDGLWGSHANHPPTDRIDAVTVRALPVTGQWRQSVFAGDKAWFRETTRPSNGKVTWPRSWTGPASLAQIWGGHLNHPPVDRVDAVSVRPSRDAQGRACWRQIVVAGETTWSRQSTDANGTAWPAAWDSTTLAAALSAPGVDVSSRPPIYAVPG